MAVTPAKTTRIARSQKAYFRKLHLTFSAAKCGAWISNGSMSNRYTKSYPSRSSPWRHPLLPAFLCNDDVMLSGSTSGGKPVSPILSKAQARTSRVQCGKAKSKIERLSPFFSSFWQQLQRDRVQAYVVLFRTRFSLWNKSYEHVFLKEVAP